MQSTKPDICLNPDLDVERFSQSLKADGRVQIENFLTQDSAEKLRKAMLHKTPWCVTFTDGERTRDYLADDYLKMPTEERHSMDRQVYQVASTKFQFFYYNYRFCFEGARNLSPGAYLNSMEEFLNSPKMLNFANKLSGRDDIVELDGQATCYRPGHFLGLHNDHDSSLGRITAYVLNLSKDWRPEFGGTLLFYDDSGRIISGFVPKFNSLNAFTVPIWHSVSMVTPISTGPRLSIAGWFLNKKRAPLR